MPRLFFACWPSEDAARELARLAPEVATRSGGRPVPAGKIHLTLAFLGDIGDERFAALEAAACEVHGEPFTLVLDRLGAFRRAGVAWIGASDPQPALVRLQAGLATALAARDFELEARPFAPHVTLARRVERPIRDEAVAPLAWRVTDFALVRSVLGTGRYETLRRWPLAG